MTTYLHELAGIVHGWYHHTRTVGEPAAIESARLLLARAARDYGKHTARARYGHRRPVRGSTDLWSLHNPVEGASSVKNHFPRRCTS